MPDTYLSQAVDATDGADAAYDSNAKYLLADRQVLARILKYALSEFGNMEIPDIMDCIRGGIEIGSRPVEPGLSAAGRVQGDATEDSVPGEGLIFYDIRFTAYLAEKEMKFLVNVEAQKSSDPAKLGYHLENRILFYLARMVSAQKQTEFFHSDFDNLKPVRSIWICMDREEGGEDSIEELSLCRRLLLGKKAAGSEIDLMKAVIVRIRAGEDRKNTGNALTGMLGTLFAQTPASEKKRLLAENYAMEMTAELERRIQIMCNLSENIRAEGIELGIERGIEQGIKRGIEQGIERGIEQERIAAVRRMICAGASGEQILSYGYTRTEYERAGNSPDARK